MKKVPVGLALRDRLGETGVRDLDDYTREHGETWRVNVVDAMSERLDSRFSTLDYRFSECAKREDMIVAFSRVEKQIDANKVEILRWSFVFWIGQVATIAVLLSYMLK